MATMADKNFIFFVKLSLSKMKNGIYASIMSDN